MIWWTQKNKYAPMSLDFSIGYNYPEYEVVKLRRPSIQKYTKVPQCRYQNKDRVEETAVMNCRWCILCPERKANGGSYPVIKKILDITP